MNILELAVGNPDELLSSAVFGAGALIRVESSATQVGGYSELGTVSLVTLTTFYTYNHAAGTPGLWYQTRYSDAGGTKFSGYSTPWQGGGRLYLSQLDHVRRLVNPDSPNDTSHDGELIQYMAATTDLIHTMQERYFLQDPIGNVGTSTLTFDGQWGNPHAYGWAWGGQGPSNRYDRLYVSRGIRSVTSLKIRTGGTGSTQVTIPAASYVLRPTAQERDPGQPAMWIELVYPPSYTFFLIGSDVIEIIGTFGYDAVPPVIEGISDRTVLRAWRARGSGLGEAVGGVPNAGFIQWAMSKDDQNLLQSHYSEWPLVR